MSMTEPQAPLCLCGHSRWQHGVFSPHGPQLVCWVALRREGGRPVLCPCVRYVEADDAE